MPIGILARRLALRTKCDHIPGHGDCPNSRLQTGAKKNFGYAFMRIPVCFCLLRHPLGTDIYLAEIPSSIAAVLSIL